LGDLVVWWIVNVWFPHVWAMHELEVVGNLEGVVDMVGLQLESAQNFEVVV
jgi:hypothetical protein